MTIFSNCTFSLLGLCTSPFIVTLFTLTRCLCIRTWTTFVVRLANTTGLLSRFVNINKTSRQHDLFATVCGGRSAPLQLFFVKESRPNIPSRQCVGGSTLLTRAQPHRMAATTVDLRMIVSRWIAETLSFCFTFPNYMGYSTDATSPNLACMPAYLFSALQWLFFLGAFKDSEEVGQVHSHSLQLAAQLWFMELLSLIMDVPSVPS